MRAATPIVLAVLVLAGCSRKPAEPVARPDAPEEQAFADMRELFMEVDRLRNRGDFDGAIGALAWAIDDDEFVPARTYIFARWLDTLIDAERVDDAWTGYMEAVGKDESLARAGFDTMYSRFRHRKRIDALAEWTGMLADSPLPDDLALAAFEWHMSACLDAGLFDRVLELAPDCLERFDDPSCRRILGRAVGALVSEGMYPEAERMLSSIEMRTENRKELAAMVVASRPHLASLQGNWMDAERHFLRAAPVLPDADLLRTLRLVAPLAMEAGEQDMLDRLCDHIMANMQEKANARREAARLSVDIARQGEDVSEVIRRIELLLSQFELPPGDVFSVYSGNVRHVIQDGESRDLVRMFRFGDRLAPLLKTENNIQDYMKIALDFSFMTDDYARSLAILEDEAFRCDPDWREMAVNKIRAHKALKEGNKEEAIERFRGFMKHVAEQGGVEYDPSTGMSHTRDMVLGFNARRIGEIKAAMGDEEGARKAYEEARAHYERALREFSSKEKEHAHLTTMLAELQTLEGGLETAVTP